MITDYAAYWPMDEASGDIVDYSGNGYTGTVHGTSVVSGKINKGRSFGASSSDYIDISRTVQNVGTGNFSLCLWAKCPSQVGGTYNYALVWGSQTAGSPFTGIEIYFGFGSGGEGATKLTFRVDNANNLFYSNAAVSDNLWHHWGFIRDSSTSLRLYLDGVSVSTATVSSINVDVATSGIRIGANPTDNTVQNLEGSLDEIRFYNRALEASEVNQIFTFGYNNKFNSGIRPRPFTPGIAR